MFADPGNPGSMYVNDGPTMYINEQMEEKFRSLVHTVDTLHMSAKTFYELANTRCIKIDSRLAKKAKTSVAIVVDDPLFIDIPGGRNASASSDCVVLDALTDDAWFLLERTTFKGLVGGPSRQVAGAFWALKKNVFGSVPSDKFGRFVGDEIEPWGMPEADVWRVFSIALGSCWLVQHDRVNVTTLETLGTQRHFRLELPDDLSVEKAIRELLEGRHIARQPSILHRVLRAGLDILRKCADPSPEKSI